MRIDNEYYLRNHPEIKTILDYFMHEILVQRPADVLDFATGTVLSYTQFILSPKRKNIV